MPASRPTYHEAWHRVEALRPRLRSGIGVARQCFRGERWHVIEDPAANQFFRLSTTGYALVGLLDGRRTLGDAWTAVINRFGDDAPTQGEALRLLGQLYSANLLSAEVPDDTRALLRRYRMRQARRVQSGITGLLSLRIPIADPDRLLSTLAGPLGWLYSPIGLVLWAIWVLLGLTQLPGQGGELAAQASRAVSPEHLPLLALVFVVSKLVHELSHGLACKTLSRREGREGPVHTLGVMLLLLFPAPFVDASSAWGLRSKWSRIVVGAAGMMAELALASLAAFLWARTSPGTAANDAAFNAMLVAGVSTIVFNANPLLRYDGYYILSDLLEIPNLQQRSQSAVYDLVKRHIWRIPGLPPSTETPGHRALLIAYGFLAGAYRIAISVALILFIGGQYFVIGSLLAIVATSAWIIAPIASFVRYLAGSSELNRIRHRAAITTTLAVGTLLAAIGLYPAPERIWLEGVAEPLMRTTLRMPADGVILSAPQPGARIETGPTPFIVASNPELRAEASALDARLQAARARQRKAAADNPALARMESERVAAARAQAEQAQHQLESLDIRAPHPGTWIVKEPLDLVGRHLLQGQEVGELVDLSSITIRARASQDAAAILAAREPEIELRSPAEAGRSFAGTVTRVVEAAVQRDGSPEPGVHPTPAARSASRDFEVLVKPDSESPRLLPGQRVTIRFTVGRRPLLAQWWSALSRSLQRRLEVRE